MAWSSAIEGRTVAGNKRIHYGTWDATGATGGDIDTGLKICEMCVITPTGSAVEADAAVINETSWPMEGNGPTVVCTSGDAGVWIAIGY